MKILVIPCGMSSRYIFETALRKYNPCFLSRSKVEAELRKRSDYNLIVLDSMFQDLYGVHIFKNMEALSPHIPKLVIAECGEIRNELHSISRNEYNCIIRPPRVKYLEDLSETIIKRNLDELNENTINEESRLINLADAIDDVEEITRRPIDHYLRVKQLAEDIYDDLDNNLSFTKNVLSNFSYLHDVNRTRVPNSILNDIADKDKRRFSAEDYFKVFCGVGELDEIVKTMPGWGHFYLGNYKKNENDMLSDIVAAADAYDIYKRKFNKEGKDADDKSMIIEELKKTKLFNPRVLESLSKAA